MTRLIIGSTAMARSIPGSREPKDLDTFSPHHHSTNEDCYWHPSFESWIPVGTDRYATLSEQYTIKVSHSPWALKNGSWAKHMSDVVRFKEDGAKLIPWLHDLLYAVWEELHGKKRVNLDMDADSFFSDAVKRTYVHDSIHESVAYYDRPLWESFLVPGESVKMDMAAIKAAPFETQVQLFREEVYATALERYVIPSNYECSPRKAYADALKKTITSLTKRWSSRFLIENYGVFRMPDIDYVRHHQSRSHFLIPLEETCCTQTK